MLRRCALLLALIFVILCQPAPGQILQKGMAVATNFSGYVDPSNFGSGVNNNGHVIAVIDIRNKTSHGIQSGTNWSNSLTYPSNIQQVNGTCYSPTVPDGNNAAHNDRNGNPAGGPAHSILCYPQIPNANGPDYDWNAIRMGQVFGLALDGDGNIYTTASSVYGDFNRDPTNPAKNRLPGLVFRIDRSTGKVTDFITASNGASYVSGSNQIPNTSGVGLGNIAYDPIHKQLLVTNFEDGLIYRLQGLTNPQGTIVGTPYGPFDTAPYFKSDEGMPGFADAGFSSPSTSPNEGRRLWAIGAQVQNGTSVRVYFSVWSEDQYRSSRGTHNKIWSVSLDSAGGFAPKTLRDESTNGLTIPIFSDNNTGYLNPGGHWSNPISDIEFSSTGNMLVAERTMWSNGGNGDYGSLGPPAPAHQAAHNSRVLEFAYNAAADGWGPTPGLYYLNYAHGEHPGRSPRSVEVTQVE
jgi:hypothetical protein